MAFPLFLFFLQELICPLALSLSLAILQNPFFLFFFLLFSFFCFFLFFFCVFDCTERISHKNQIVVKTNKRREFSSWAQLKLIWQTPRKALVIITIIIQQQQQQQSRQKRQDDGRCPPEDFQPGSHLLLTFCLLSKASPSSRSKSLLPL